MSASWDDEEQTPELPNRDYLEDIDFVSKEFELFFTRQPDLPARMYGNVGDDSKNHIQVEVSCSKEQPAAIVEDDAKESGHYMSLKNAQEGSQSSASAYESLKPRKEQQQPTAYENVKEESNTGSHYQPLMLAQQESKDYTSSHYQSLNLKLT